VRKPVVFDINIYYTVNYIVTMNRS